MKKIAIVMAVILLSGCATVEMTSEARMVRELSLDTGNNCQFLGAYDTSITIDYVGGSNRGRVTSHVRNEVASMGGNAFILQSMSEGTFSWSIHYDAYIC